MVSTAQTATLLFVLLLVSFPTPAEGGIPLPPPWVMLWGTMAFAKTITTVKDIGMLVVDVIFKGEGAMCTLCDKVMTMMLSGEAEGGLSDIDCRAMCFGLKRCITICDKLVKALSESSKFPCVAAGYCPQIDEFGEVPKCKYHFPASCEPSNMCTYKFPGCQLSDGYKKWRKMNKMMSENVGALANALGKAPKCGEPGAHPLFCINEPTGSGLWAMRLSYVLALWACFKSVHAIETPGGDDDRQWLSFWIIFLILNVIENMTDVLLSWIPSYYEAKFVLLAWLIFFEGADILYRRVHSLFEVIHALLVRLHVIPEVVYEEWNEEEYLETLPLGLAETIKECGGPGCVFRKFTSRSDMEDMLRDRRTKQLLRAFEDVNPRYVEVHLVKAEGLAAMDANGLSDPYCLLSLVPTAREEEEIEDASSHALTRFARLKLLVQSGLSAVISRLKSLIGMKGKEQEQDAPQPTHKEANKLCRPLKGLKVEIPQEKRSAPLARSRTMSTSAALEREKRLTSSTSWKSEGDLTEAVNGVKRVPSAISLQAMWKVVSKGPPSLPGEYAKVKSRIVSKSLNPKFDQKFKLYLEGGNLSDHGVYQNHSAPFTMLRVQMFDNDKLSLDDFMGEIRVPLCPLMTCRTLEGWFDLEDPEGAYEEEEPVKGRVYLRLKWNRDCLLEGSLRPKGKQREIKISDLDSPLAPSRGMNVQNKFLDDEASIRNGIAVYTNSIPKHLNVKLGAARVEEGEKGASEGRETANVEIYSPAIKQKEEADAETPIDKMVKDKCKQVKDGLDLLEMKRNELHAKMNQMRSNLFNRTAAQQDESDWVKGVFTLDKSIDQVEEAPSNIEIRNALKQVQESSLLLRKRNMLLKQSLEKGRAQQRFELARTEDGMLTVVKADGDTESESLKEGDVVHAMQGQDVAIVTDAEVFSLLENHATVVVTVIRDSTTSLDLDVTASSLVLVDSQVAPSHASLSRSNTLVKELPNHDEVVVL